MTPIIAFIVLQVASTGTPSLVADGIAPCVTDLPHRCQRVILTNPYQEEVLVPVVSRHSNVVLEPYFSFECQATDDDEWKARSGTIGSYLAPSIYFPVRPGERREFVVDLPDFGSIPCAQYRVVVRDREGHLHYSAAIRTTTL